MSGVVEREGQTDRQMDRQTDGRTDTGRQQRPRLRTASRGETESAKKSRVVPVAQLLLGNCRTPCVGCVLQSLITQV